MWQQIAELKLWAENEIATRQNWGDEEWTVFDNSTVVKFTQVLPGDEYQPACGYFARAYELDPDGAAMNKNGDANVRLI